MTECCSNSTSGKNREEKNVGTEQEGDLYTAARFPLDPLRPEEIKQTYNLIEAHISSHPELSVYFKTRPRYMTMSLHDPCKRTLLGALYNKPNSHIPPRKSMTILLSQADTQCYEVLANLTTNKIDKFLHVPNVHPPCNAFEYEETEEVVKSSALVLEHLKKRGIHSTENVMVDLWAPGANYIGEPTYPENQRIGKPLLFFKSAETINPNLPKTNSSNTLNTLYAYARPIEGLIPVVDLVTKQVIAVEDTILNPDPTPLPVPEHDNFTPSRSPPVSNFHNQVPAANKRNQSLKPYKVVQKDGPSWKLFGDHGVQWGDWRFRVGFTPREGIVLNLVQIWDSTKNKYRDLIYRGSLSEMIVPYGDPSWPNYRKNAFDAGEDGIGANINSLNPGSSFSTVKDGKPQMINCDCIGEVHFWDAFWSAHDGQSVTTVKNAICMHEEDTGILYKHTFRDGTGYMRRGRRLVVSCFVTVANYDYGFSFSFSLDGSLSFEVKMTGFINTTAYDYVRGGPNAVSKYRVKYNNYGLDSPVHQHFFILRLNMAVDGFQGKNQQLVEVDLVDPGNHGSKDNLQSNAFHPVEKQIRYSCGRQSSPHHERFWKIRSTKILNKVSLPTSYRIVPISKNPVPRLHETSALFTRAAVLKKTIWVTKYDESERFPCGDYPNQHKGGVGLPHYTRIKDGELVKEGNELKGSVDLEGEDLVVWYVLGATHVPRLEDFPIMPVTTCGMMLEPDGFFDENPAVDLPEGICPKIRAAKEKERKESKL
eukprot:TRINITY_DN2885_c2_g1_i1.p1 TRINITY_DN2885_c2_g1~~TRINITY_DN2885_c2_g1_i1.p1  ORF type:complete len:763 (-),score=138.44 TRINITY_DN2885_c2_g1_i1:93-2381(-)